MISAIYIQLYLFSLLQIEGHICSAERYAIYPPSILSSLLYVLGMSCGILGKSFECWNSRVVLHPPTPTTVSPAMKTEGPPHCLSVSYFRMKRGSIRDSFFFFCSEYIAQEREEKSQEWITFHAEMYIGRESKRWGRERVLSEHSVRLFPCAYLSHLQRNSTSCTAPP